MRTFAKTPQKSEKNQDFAAFLRVSNFYYFAARASPTSSLVPLKSLVEALFNGARLEVGGARGADLWLFANTRKHAKSRTSYNRRKHRLSNKSATGGSPRIRPYSVWALSEIPLILGFTKNDTFSNKENLFRPVLGCMSSSGGVQTRVFHKITSCIRYINTNARDLPEKRFFRRRQKPRPPRARTRISLENFSL